MQLHWQPVLCMCDISYCMRWVGCCAGAQAESRQRTIDRQHQSTGSTNQHNKTHLEGGTTKNDPNNNSTWCDSLARAISLVVCRPASQPASSAGRHTHSVMLLRDTPMPHTCTCSPTRQPLSPRHDTTCTCCCCCTDTGYTPTTWLSFNTAGELLVHYAIHTLLPQQQLGCRCSASSNTNPERQLLNKKRQHLLLLFVSTHTLRGLRSPSV